MEDNLNQGSKSSKDIYEDLSLKKDSSTQSVNNSSSSMKKELSNVIIKDISSDIDPISLKQSKPSATSDLILTNESFKGTNSKFEGSGSKSKTSFETYNNKSYTVTQKTSSMNSEKVSLNHLSRINYSKETRLDQASSKSSCFNGGDEETTSGAIGKMNVSSSHYSPQLAESSTSCKPTASQSTTKRNEVKENFDSLKCIPPWAKSLQRQFHGMSSSHNGGEVQQENLQDKIKSLMEKHSRLMLIKRGESRKEITLEPNEYGDMGKVKVATKNTRYYMSPIPRDAFRDDTETSVEHFSPKPSNGSNIMEVTKKTSKRQAKKEVSDVLKSLYNSKTQRETVKEDHKLKKESSLCPKITPSNIRDYVKAQTLDLDSQKLHEIIKIKKVPSFGNQVGKKSSSKYIINVPKSTKGDGPTINKITVKEKRKIRIDDAEDINENVTQIVYNNDPEPQEKTGGGYTANQNVLQDVVPYSKLRKSPTKTRTLEVTAERTPIISNMVKKEEKGKDKVLLIQYEKKLKPGKDKFETEQSTLVSTQLFGIRKPCNEATNEMYLYGTERDGKKCKETITQVDDISPTLREKVNMIFQELRDMTFKPCEEFEPSPESKPSVTSKTTQHPSMLVETDAVSIQAFPDVRSTEVQVTDSLLYLQRQSITETKTMKSERDKKKRLSPLENEILDTTDDLADPVKVKQEKIYSKEPIGVDPTQVTDVNEDEEILGTDDEEEISEVEGEKLGTGSVTEEGESKLSKRRSKEDDEIQEKEHKEETEPEEEKSDVESVQSEIKSIEDQEELSSKDDQDDQISDKYEEKLGMVPEEEKEETMNDIGLSLLKEKSNYDVNDHHPERIMEFDKDKEQDGVKEAHNVAGDEETYHDELGDMEKPFFTEDIRSYDFDPAQDYELKMVPSSKFFHQRDSLRKLNWTEDIIYLENNLCPQLTKALAEIAIKQPADPISYLAHWIYKEYENQENEEKNLVFKEHLEVAKGMIMSKKNPKLVYKKFGVRRYPLKSQEAVEVELTASKTSDITGDEKPETNDLE